MSNKRTNALQQETTPLVTDNLLIDRGAYVEAKRITIEQLIAIALVSLDGRYVNITAFNAGILNLQNQINAHTSDIANVVASVGNVQTSLTAEVSARINGDNVNAANIATNTAAIADNTADIAANTADIIDEINDRIAGDAALDAAKQNVLGFTPENAANKGVANGYTPLGADSKVPSLYLPAYVDDVIEAANFAALPVTGETGKIYVTLDTNFEYRWSGSVYVRIAASPGSTDDVPEGSVNKYFTAARVLAVVLTGISFATGTAVVSTDTMLVAIGKLQAQITAAIGKVLPDGGTTGQILAKINATDYNTTWISGNQIKSYQLMMAPVGLNEVPFYFLNAGNITAGSISGATGLKLKTGIAGTYPVGAQIYPFAYAAGDRVYATFNYSDLTHADANIILTCQDN